VEGALISRKRAGLTIGPGKQDRRQEAERSRASPPVAERASEGSRSDATRSRQSCRACTPRARARRESSLDPKPATCRQARSRWRLGDRKVVRRPLERRRRRPVREDLEAERRRDFPTALGRKSPESVFSRRVLVSETSVVEADSKHSGGASKASREAHRGAHRRATGRQKAWTRPTSFTSRKGATVRGGRKTEAGPR
jgi:hypothetical protein